MTKIIKDKKNKLEELKHYRDVAAKVVALYGDAYLPVFERMHKLVLEHQQQADLKSLALSLVQEKKQS